MDVTRNYKFEIKKISLLTLILISVIICTYIIKAYSQKKQDILFDLQNESHSLENSFINDIQYASHFINLILAQIKQGYGDIKRITSVLQEYAHLSNFDTVFGWRKYSFVDQNFFEVATSINGIEKEPKELSYVKQMALNNVFANNQLQFYTSRTKDKNSSLKVIANLPNAVNRKYLGSVILSCDIATITRRLNIIKKHSYTKFIILDNKFNIVSQTHHAIPQIIQGSDLDPKIQDTINRFNIFKVSGEVSFLNMVNGDNFYIKKVDDLPFIILVSFDSISLKNSIILTLVKKFIEIGASTAICLFVILSVFKREISLRVKVEQATLIASKAAKTKYDFLAFTAHEIRSPLGFILTGSEMMCQELLGILPIQYKNYAQGIYQNSKIILDFLTDILDENQILEGKFKIVNSIVNIGSVLNAAIEVNRARYNKRDVRVDLAWEPNLPHVICDQRRVLQIMSNLLSNAIKYSLDKTAIKISGYILNENLVIQFLDRGIGMTREELKSVLSYSTINSNYNFIDSYGLGLPIVKMLLDAQDGSISITSEKNVGTTVSISFPRFKLVYSHPL